jgi:protein-tyrosine-phosphatase
MVLVLPFAVMVLGEAEPRPREPSGTVVFVCEHGNVKSLIAREWFNRLAAERGLGLRAISRGVTPGASVPPAIAAALGRDGFDVRGFEPRVFSASESAGVVRVIAIGVDLSVGGDPGKVPVEMWERIPPATESYVASRDALRTRIEDLLKTLEIPGP